MKRLEAEANSEATSSIRKRKQKIPKMRKRKRTRKHKTSRGAGSGSIKNLTASTSLMGIQRKILKAVNHKPDQVNPICSGGGANLPPSKLFQYSS